MFEIGTQLWISRSHGYLEVWLKSPKVRDTDFSVYLHVGSRNAPNVIVPSVD